MKWLKKGRVFRASGQSGWMQSHTQVPVVLVLEDRLRVYFSTRPESGMSHATFIDLDLADPSRVLALYPQPILPLGDAGMFDEHGIIPNHVFWHDGKVHLFYVGWSRRESVPYSNWMGMAVSGDSGTTFTRAFPGPILDRTPSEVYSATGLICVRHNDCWHGWYAAGISWLRVNGRLEHTTSCATAAPKISLTGGVQIHPSYRVYCPMNRARAQRSSACRGNGICGSVTAEPPILGTELTAIGLATPGRQICANGLEKTVTRE